MDIKKNCFPQKRYFHNPPIIFIVFFLYLIVLWVLGFFSLSSADITPFSTIDGFATQMFTGYATVEVRAMTYDAREESLLVNVKVQNNLDEQTSFTDNHLMVYYGKESLGLVASKTGWNVVYIDPGPENIREYNLNVDVAALEVQFALSAYISLGNPFIPPPVSFWNFSEGEGGFIYDNVGGNTGQIINATWVDGVYNKALKFNGVNSYIVIPNAPSLNPTTELTLAAWVKWSIDPATGNQWASIINKNADSQYRLQHNNNNSLFEFAIRTEPNGNRWVVSTTSPVVDTWYFVVGTYDGSLLKIYVNGVFENSNGHAGTLLTPVSSVNIGRRTVNDRYFEGIIDEVAIFDVALTADEVKALYER